MGIWRIAQRIQPLTDEELKRIEKFADTRFDCVFWNMPNMRRVIQRLLAHIKYLEGRKK
jgi:hypothetical protein